MNFYEFMNFSARANSEIEIWSQKRKST